MHTPGPWAERLHLGNKSQGRRVYVLHDDPLDTHDAICDLYVWQTPEQTRGNARLIAAAPNLLAALQEAQRWIAKLAADNDETGNVIGMRAVRILEANDAVIAKATGK